MRLRHEQIIRVGRLGKYRIETGSYIYLGSAHGPGGLRSRLKRHLSGSSQNLHWHIDYFKAIADIQACYYLKTPAIRKPQDLPMECRWSQGLANLPDARIPIPGFGSSDCKTGCRAHLVQFPKFYEAHTFICQVQNHNIFPEKPTWVLFD